MKLFISKIQVESIFQAQVMKTFFEKQENSATNTIDDNK